MKTYQKQPRIKNKKITNSARNEDCTLRIAGVCNFDPSTTVFAHMNGGGMGYKHHDIHGCYACSDCHNWLDGGYVKYFENQYDSDLGKQIARIAAHAFMVSEFNPAMIETQNKLIAKGLIKL